MLTRSKITGLVVALTMLSMPMVYADPVAAPMQPPETGAWHQGPWHHEGPEHMLAQILGLSDQQVAQLKALHETQRAAMKSVHEQVKANREAFEAEITKATPDTNKINDLESQFKTIQGQMVDSHLNDLLAIKKIMTPEQFAGFMALKKEMQIKRHMMMGKRFGPKGECGKDGHGPWGNKGPGNGGQGN